MPDIANSWFDVELFIVDDKTMQYDLLLGRQFFVNSNIKLNYDQRGFSFEKEKHFEGDVYAILAIDVEKSDKYDQIENNLDADVSYFARKKLVEVFKSVDTKEIEPIQDDYSVKLNIKDDSLFRFAPRRLSFTEKNELDAIIDDLLKREIIKPSISPYCSRAILVPKRNDQKRMCIDLRPLNQRVHPQKYFPNYRRPFRQTIWQEIFYQVRSERVFIKLKFIRNLRNILLLLHQVVSMNIYVYLLAFRKRPRSSKSGYCIFSVI